MTRSYWLGLGFVGVMAGAASCGDGPVNTADSGGRPGRGGSNSAGSTSSGGEGGQQIPAGVGVGDACSDDEPCRPGLVCNDDSVCEPGHSLTQGSPSVRR